MLATLTRPTVTDYTPVVRPPWLLFALAVAVFAVVLPRELLPVLIGVAAVVGVIGLAIERFWVRPGEAPGGLDEPPGG